MGSDSTSDNHRMKTVTIHIDSNVLNDMKKFYTLQIMGGIDKSIGDDAWCYILKKIYRGYDDIILQYKDKNIYDNKT